MALSIDYITRIISVPKADLTLVQSTPFEIYELDINAFRLELKDIEDSPPGVPFVDTHSHNTTVTVGGVTLARVFIIINGYTVTFEDGSYAVNLIDANSNIADVVNLNSVQVRSANSAGLANLAASEYASFSGGVWIDVNSTTVGTIFPAGTPEFPVNNLDDALLIAVVRGFTILNFASDFTFEATDSIANYFLIGRGMQRTTLTFTSGCIMAYCQLEHCKATGTETGIIGFKDCYIEDLGSVGLAPSSQDIIVQNCLVSGTVTIPSNYSGTLKVLDCWSNVPGSSIPILDSGGSTADMLFRNYSGGIQINNLTQTVEIGIDLNSGHVKLDATCTGGTVTIRGVGKLTDASTGTTVNSNDLLNRDKVSTAVWDEPIIDHIMEDTTGYEALLDAYDDEIHVHEGAGSGTSYPYGTHGAPVGNIADALTIATLYGIKRIRIFGSFTIDGEDVEDITFFADRSLGNAITVTSMVNAGQCYFQDLTVSGALTGATRLTTCVTGALTGVDGGLKDCLLTGTITISGAGSNYFTNCDTYFTTMASHIDVDIGANTLNIIRTRGAYNIINKTSTSILAADLVAGLVTVDSTCTAGDIMIGGNCAVTDNSAAGCTVTVSALSNPLIADTVWDELTTGHTTAGTTGKALIDAGAAGNPWDAPISGSTTPGTFGELVGQKLLTVAKFLGLK